MFETKNYPKSSVIEAKTPCNKFIYRVIQEGIYPNKNIFSYTLKPNQCRIPHEYVVETTFGRGKAQKTVICSINYQNNMPESKILKQISEIRDKHQTTRSCKTFSDLITQTFNNQDNVTFEELTFTVNLQKFYINYNEINNDIIDLQQQVIIRAMDSEKISRQAYRLIAAIGHDLLQE
ncbi:hypothetical protein C2G38_2185506 [Gigaspora rosea]|uniref:Uncharacterized protein n=1 Tax=Gigaspora rosea TaxID=44941 RepID=A0A397VAZ6_9GLOM|nr:hypothetical protein C2G38_2185506 [Gigaspora rosea]